MAGTVPSGGTDLEQLCSLLYVVLARLRPAGLVQLPNDARKSSEVASLEAQSAELGWA